MTDQPNWVEDDEWDSTLFRLWYQLSRPLRGLSERTLLVVVFTTPLLGHVLVGQFYNWPLLVAPIHHPLPELIVDAAVMACLTYLISVPALVELRRQYRLIDGY